MKRPLKKRLKLCYNPKKLADSFSLTLIALISYLFLNAENLIFLKVKFGKLAGFGRVVSLALRVVEANSGLLR
ncbi:hypothetical protein NYG88_03925 [Campylobacter felis]|uniref:hypothetical protein n=1 Tax=Campylobacter felis TaxID=2974565 RepID=UPI002563105C|nr:hypothetical protein [Campylobacter felis]